MCLYTIYKCTGYEYYYLTVNLFMMRFTNEYFEKTPLSKKAYVII